jgi:hypothetical protein
MLIHGRDISWILGMYLFCLHSFEKFTTYKVQCSTMTYSVDQTSTTIEQGLVIIVPL